MFGCVFKLLAEKPDSKILVIEKNAISSGGLRNDCKMNFNYRVGFPTEFWNKDNAEKYLAEVRQFLVPKIEEKKNLEHYECIAKRLGIEMIEVEQSHLGTDGGKLLIEDLTKRLQNLGVEFKFNETFKDYSNVVKVGISLNEKPYSICYPSAKNVIVTTDKGSYETKNLLIALGRHGFDQSRDLMKNHKIGYTDNSIDIGVRIETELNNYPIVKDYYDPKFIFPEKTRTFCTNSGDAHVVQEKYTSKDGQDYYLVNGHAYSKLLNEPNGMVNFAMLRTNFFTEPMASGQDFAEHLAKMVMLAGGGHPIYQRVEDIRLHTRSSSSGEKNFSFKPTLSSAVPGDITMVMPSKFFNSIWKSMKQLDTIVPGVMNPNTILYFPEIKFYANKPKFIDDNFKVDDGIYMAGDGFGTSRGITAAWASGIRVAEELI
jgi:uncharacterized FAD-dependent dehydrogenase